MHNDKSYVPMADKYKMVWSLDFITSCDRIKMEEAWKYYQLSLLICASKIGHTLYDSNQIGHMIWFLQLTKCYIQQEYSENHWLVFEVIARLQRNQLHCI